MLTIVMKTKTSTVLANQIALLFMECGKEPEKAIARLLIESATNQGIPMRVDHVITYKVAHRA